MALTPDFSTYQEVGSPSIVNIVDTSTGSDVAIDSRRVYLVDSQGNYVVPSGTTTDYVVWSYADTEIAIDCLSIDMALNITVLWLDSGGVTLYSKTRLQGFTLYNMTFFYSLTQSQASQQNPPINVLQDTDYYASKTTLLSNIESGDNAIVYGGDIFTAQLCYDMATFMVQNEAKFF